jgi:hypothetical protein
MLHILGLCVSHLVAAGAGAWGWQKYKVRAAKKLSQIAGS